MSDLQDPPEDQPEGQPSAAGDEHISFVERLESHFGHSVDPEIDLLGAEHDSDDQGQLSKQAGDEESSSSSRALMRKLAESVQLGARFKVKREIARGGMGIIFRVWDQDLRRNLAMKVMHSNSSVEASGRPEDLDQEKLGRFLEEAQITGQLDHPGIVPVHDLGIDTQGRCYFTMRLVRGRELKEVLELMREGKEGWTRTKVLSLILKVCESMAFAHSKGVVHRDLKPQNIMVGRFGEVYVMDWGLARVLGRRDSHDIRLRPEADEPSSLSLVRTVRKDDSEANPDSSLVTMDGDVVGTPSFMAVEQAQGKLDEVGVRSDVYSLGSILYYMLTGRSPYVTPGERASPHTVLNRVLQGPPEPVSTYTKDEPAELVAICEKAMHRDASRRYESMLGVAEDIQAYLEDRVVGAYEGGSLAEARKWISRNRGIAMASAALLVLIFASAIGFAALKQNQVSDLEASDKLLQASLNDATDSKLEMQAQKNEAERQTARAETSLGKAEAAEKDAIRSAEQANRAGYHSKILAADFSLRLNDVKEARNQLKGSGNTFRDWEHHYLDLLTRSAMVNIDQLKKKSGRSNGSYSRNKGPIDQVAWGPDGERLALLTREGWLRFMRPENGAAAMRADIDLEHPSALLRTGVLVPKMSFNTDDLRVALVGFDNLVHVFDVPGRRALMELPLAGQPGHSGRVSQVAYSEVDGLLMTGSDTGEVIVWGADGAHYNVRSRQGLAVTALAWSPNGKQIVAGFSDGAAWVWDFAQPLFEIHRLEGHAGSVTALAFNADGSKIYSAGVDGKLNTWDRAGGRLLSSYSGHTDALVAMDSDPHRARVVTASRDQTLRLWDMQTGQSRVLLGHEAEVRSVAFSSDGRFLVSSDAEGLVKTWDAHFDASKTDLEPMPGSITCALFDPTGKLVASADGLGNLVLWDALSGLPRARLLGHQAGKKISALAFDEDGSHLFSASEDSTVRRWNTATGRQSSTYKHVGAVSGLAVDESDSTNKRLYTASGKNIHTFDIDTRQELSRFEASSHRITGLQLYLGGQRLGTTDSSSLILWDVTGTGTPRRFELPGSQGKLSFSPNGERVVSSSHRGDVRGWNLDGPEGMPLQMEATFGVNAIGYHPDGRRFATGGRDGSIRIWDADTGEILLTLAWPGQYIRSIAFGSDGSRLVAGSSSGAIRIWETDLVGTRRRHSFEQREQRAALQPEVDSLFDEHFFVSDVLAALEGHPDLDENQRETALLLAHLRGDDARFHAKSSMGIAMGAGHSQEQYAKARRQAEAALLMSPEQQQPILLLALGMTSYRVQDIGKASTWLNEAHLRNLEIQDQATALEMPLGHEQALVLTLFQAMASFQRGKTQAALRLFDQASSAIRSSDTASLSEGLGDLVNEVREKLAGS